MKKLFLLLTALLLSLAPVTEAYGQSADSKYEEGVAQYNKGNTQAAIKLFKESMILNKSAANKKRCNAMIAKCNKSGKKAKSDDPKPAKAELLLDRNHLSFNGRSSDADVISITATNGWNFRYVDSEDARWCILEKSQDGRTLKVKAEPSHLTVPREAKIMITDAVTPSYCKELFVKQGSGKEPYLTALPTELDRIANEGEEEVIKITCVSDTLYSDGKNWRLGDYPSWVRMLPDKPKVTGIKSAFASKNDKNARIPVEANELSLKIEPNTSTDERLGEVVIQSQNSEMRIKLKQKAQKAPKAPKQKKTKK